MIKKRLEISHHELQELTDEKIINTKQVTDLEVQCSQLIREKEELQSEIKGRREEMQEKCCEHRWDGDHTYYLIWEDASLFVIDYAVQYNSLYINVKLFLQGICGSLGTRKPETEESVSAFGGWGVWEGKAGGRVSQTRCGKGPDHRGTEGCGLTLDREMAKSGFDPAVYTRGVRGVKEELKK